LNLTNRFVSYLLNCLEKPVLVAEKKPLLTDVWHSSQNGQLCLQFHTEHFALKKFRVFTTFIHIPHELTNKISKLFGTEN